jgi:hypothetical protein
MRMRENERKGNIRRKRARRRRAAGRRKLETRGQDGMGGLGIEKGKE